MHLPRLALLSLLGASVFVASGCKSTPSAEPAKVSKVFVRDVVASTLHVTDTLANAVHDAEVRALSSHGFTVVANEADADATLRSSWRTQKSTANRADDSKVSLSISLFDKSNHRLFEGTSGPGVSANFWSDSRATSEVNAILKGLPAPASAKK
jgi:hypothetical protein